MASGTIPAMRYRDVPAAIEFLCRAFGFQPRLVVDGPNGTLARGQLSYRDGMLMPGPIDRESEWGRLLRQPDGSGGSETQSPYIVVPDIDARYTRAQVAGARSVIDVAAQEHGGGLYTCRDPEGHIWSFGDHDPWRGA